MVNTNSVLSSILFSQTIDWNIKQFFSSTSINSSFELKRIGKAITRRKDQMVVEDDKRYKRITIKTNCGGVFVRDEVLGKDIKTKKQYYVKAGQLAVSKIDARNGAFGIVPPEADGAIITGNFWVSAALTQKYIDSLSLDLLDDECVESAKVMATVYTAIAAFENMVRQFVVKILMENKGENWWTECVSDKIRKSADSRKAEEDKIKWHTHRGTSMINYVDFADLANIMGQNYDLFEVHIVSLEWAKQIFTTLEKSRNVIMHSGELGERDIERIGINIRDWISQVGA